MFGTAFTYKNTAYTIVCPTPDGYYLCDKTDSGTPTMFPKAVVDKILASK